MSAVTPLSFPRTAAPSYEETVLVEVPVRYVPYALMGLEGYKLRFRWASDEDYAIGYEGIHRFQEGLLMGIGEDLIRAVDRVYMAVRQGVAGEEFEAQPGDLPPVLPVVPPALPTEAVGGVLGQMSDARGILNAGWFGIGGQRTTLADVVEALRAGDESEVDRVVGVLDALQGASSSAVIFNTVKDFFTDGAALTADGLMLATMVAAAMADAATAGLQSAQLDAMQTLLADIKAALLAPVAAPSDPALLAAAEKVRDLLTPDTYEEVEE